MTEAIGLIKDSREDKRAGKLVFLSRCMLDQNACVRGLASQPALSATRCRHAATTVTT